MDDTTVPIDLKEMIDKTGIFHSFGLHERLFLHHAPESQHGSDIRQNLTSGNNGYALVGVLILHQSQFLERVYVCICLAWIPKVVCWRIRVSV